ncbi:MAG: hypothetical protein HYT40_04010, partial [Candidatus Sungbacteria bacterium]|nr:hypothetical protein [Candidatus Sungbacteria bacterium]
EEATPGRKGRFLMPYADPVKNLQYRLAWERANRKQRNIIVARYRDKTNHLAARNHDSKRRFGLTYQQYIELKKHPCEICGLHAKKMCIDHDHKLGKGTYRGVLCQQCNVRLGWFEAKAETILTYLKKGNL